MENFLNFICIWLKFKFVFEQVERQFVEQLLSKTISFIKFPHHSKMFEQVKNKLK